MTTARATRRSPIGSRKSTRTACEAGRSDDRVWKSGSGAGSEPCGADGAKRDGGVFADRACPCADWQRSCVGTVCRSRNAGDARHTVDGAIRQGRAAGAGIGEGSGELSFVMERDRPKAGKNGGAKSSGNGPAEIQMELAEILDGIACVRVSGPTDPSVHSIAYDSRKVEAGAMFFALAW